VTRLVITTINTTIQPEREQDLLDGFTEMNDGPKPDGLVRSELLRGRHRGSGPGRQQPGAWRIQTTWRDRDALMAVRNSGKPPAALALLDRLGAEHSHGVFAVEQSHPA